MHEQCLVLWPASVPACACALRGLLCDPESQLQLARKVETLLRVDLSHYAGVSGPLEVELYFPSRSLSFLNALEELRCDLSVLWHTGPDRILGRRGGLGACVMDT